jgi:hypothetical protein
MNSLVDDIHGLGSLGCVPIKSKSRIGLKLSESFLHNGIKKRLTLNFEWESKATEIKSKRN